MGSHCLARRNLQNERRRSASLLARRALKDRRAPSHGSDRRAAAVRLCAGGREGCGGLKTPLTDEAISAKVLVWESGKLGISYLYPNDNRQIHVIGADDWPVIERLEKEGQVTFENDIALKRWKEHSERRR